MDNSTEDSDAAAAALLELESRLMSQLPIELRRIALNLTRQDNFLFRSVLLPSLFKENNGTLPQLVGSNGTDSLDNSEAYERYCQFGFLDAYKWWHCRLAVCIGVAGAVANILTVTTLTRRNMATPTNLLLLGLAVADMLVVIEYVPYAASRLLAGQQLSQSKGHALYVILHAHLSHVCHTIAIWLTISLAVWRWIAVCRPHAAPTSCTMVHARRVLLAVYVACPAIATPTFLMYTVHEHPEISYHGAHPRKLFKVDFSELALANDELLKKINFLVHSVLVKLVPCILLTLLMPAIIRGMWMAKRRRQRLVNKKPTATIATTETIIHSLQDNNTNMGPTVTDSSSLAMTPRNGWTGMLRNLSRKKTKKDELEGRSHSKKNEGATERTTSMLLVVMLLFLLTEAPQGLLIGLSLIYGQDFFSDCYLQLGDPMDLLALINSSINFLLYCVMSRQFRETFLNLYCCSRPKKSRRASTKPLEACNTVTTHI